MSEVVQAESILKISTSNVASIRAAFTKGWPDWVKKSQPDIIAVQETKMHIDAKPSYDDLLLDGYDGYFFDSERKGLHGTAIYTKIKPISVSPSFPDDEGRSITMEFEKFYLVNSYVPNAGMKLERLDWKISTWNPKIAEHIAELQKKKPVIWTGDLNVAHKEIDIFDTKGKEKVAGFTPQERKWFDEFLNKGYVDIFRRLYPDRREFTFFSYRNNNKAKGNGWRLDYFILNADAYKDGLVEDCVIEAGDFSDHVPSSLLLNRSEMIGGDESVTETFNELINTGKRFMASSSEEADEEEEKPKPKPKSTKGRARKAKVEEEEVKEEANEEEEEKPKPKPKTTKGRTRKVEVKEEDTEDDDGGSIASRCRRRHAAKKVVVEEEEEENEEENEEEEEPKPKRGRRKSTKKVDDEEFDEEEKAKPSPRRSTRNARKAKEEDEEEAEEEEKPKPKKGRRCSKK